MKTVPRCPGVILKTQKMRRPADDLEAEAALALARAVGLRQRTLDFESAPDQPAANEVIGLIDALKPAYRGKRVRRGNQTLVVVTART